MPPLDIEIKRLNIYIQLSSSIESLRAEGRGGDYDTKNSAKAWGGGWRGGGLKGCRFFLFHVTKQFELKCLSLEKPGHALKQNNVFN